jgi:hypothetical protein
VRETVVADGGNAVADGVTIGGGIIVADGGSSVAVGSWSVWVGMGVSDSGIWVFANGIGVGVLVPPQLTNARDNKHNSTKNGNRFCIITSYARFLLYILFHPD